MTRTAPVAERVVLTDYMLAVVMTDGATKTYDVSEISHGWLRELACDSLRSLLAFGSRIKSLRTVDSYLVAYRNLGRFLDEQGARVGALAELEPQMLDQFEGWLRFKYAEDSQEPYIQISRVVVSLREYVRAGGSELAADVLRRLGHTANGPIGTTQPLDGYSPYVVGQLRRAARRDIDAAVLRLGEGMRLLAMGGDPAVHGWDLQNMVWLAANNGPLVHRELEAMAWPGLLRRHPVGDVNRLLFLTYDDVLAFWIRLGLDTGLPIESIKSLKADCLVNADDRWVHVNYVKRRRHGHEHNSKRVRDGGPNTPGGLLRLAVSLTGPARRLLDVDDLWLAYGKYGLRVPEIIGAGYKRDNTPIPRFVNRHELIDDNERPLRLTLHRLRKTRKAENYRLTRGDVAAVADDHSPEVSASRYGNIPSLAAAHAQAVADGLQEALNATLPRVLLPSGEYDADAGGAPSSGLTGSRETETVRAVLSGERDVWVSNCADFFNSPFGRPGQACPKAVWGCLDCPNSIVTSDRLPAILAFRTHLTGQRLLLTEADWQATYGTAALRIEQVLTRFPPATVEAAKRITETSDVPLYLPPQIPGARSRRAR